MEVRVRMGDTWVFGDVNNDYTILPQTDTV